MRNTSRNRLVYIVVTSRPGTLILSCHEDRLSKSSNGIAIEFTIESGRMSSVRGHRPTPAVTHCIFGCKCSSRTASNGCAVATIRDKSTADQNGEEIAAGGGGSEKMEEFPGNDGAGSTIRS